MKAYEASPLCYRPDALTGEFVNIGLLMVVREADGRVCDIKFRFERQSHRVSAFFHDLWDPASFVLWRREIRRRMEGLSQALLRERQGKAQETFDNIRNELYVANLGAFQWGELSVGVLDGTSGEEFESLYHAFVSRHLIPSGKGTLSEREYWERTEPRILRFLDVRKNRDRIHVGYQALDEETGDSTYMKWRNARSMQYLEPLSFMVKEPETIGHKGQRILGMLMQRARKMPHQSTLLIAPPAKSAHGLRRKMNEQYQLLKAESSFIREVIIDEDESALAGFLQTVSEEAV